jgi:hypothetical protein
MAASKGITPLSGGQIDYFSRRPEVQFGQLMTEIGMNAYQRIEQAEFHSQYNTAKTEAFKRFSEFQQGLGDDTGEWKQQLETQQSETKEGIKFTNPRARQEFDLWFENEKQRQKNTIFSTKMQVDSRNFVKSFNLNAQLIRDNAVTAQSEQEYQKSLAEGMALYGLRPNEETGEPELIEDWDNPLLDSDEVRLKGYDAWKQTTDAERQGKLAKDAENSLYAQAVAIANQDGWDAATDFLNDPATQKQLVDMGFDSATIDKIFEDVRTQANYQKGKDEQALKRQQETDRGQIYDAIEKGEPPQGFDGNMRDFIESTSLPEKEQQELWKLAQKENLETDPDTYFKLLRRARGTGEPLTEEEIAKHVGKGITPKEYEHLLKLITDEDNPFNNRIAKRAESYLSKLKTEKNLKSEAWLKAQNDYDKWYETFKNINNRPPNRKESEEFLILLSEEPIKSLWVNDRPDSEINRELRELPFEVQRQYLQEKEFTGSTTKWIDKWRKEKKPLTVEVAKHYLLITDKNIKKAKEMWKRDGYLEE